MGLVTLAIVGLAILIGIPVAAAQFLPGEQYLGLLGLVPLLGAAVAWGFLRAERISAIFPCLAITAVLMMIGAFSWIAPTVSRHQQIVSVVRESQSPIASFGCHEPSWVFYAGRTVPHFDAGQPQPAVAFLTKQSDGRLITTQAHWETLSKSLPRGFAIRNRIPYFLRDESLIVIERDPVEILDDQTTSEHVASDPSTAPRR